MNEKYQFEAWLHIGEREIIFDHSSLGKKVNFTLGGLEMSLLFPVAVAEEGNAKLKSQHKSVIDWDERVHANSHIVAEKKIKGKFEIQEFSCKGFVVISNTEIDNTTALKIHRTLESWLESFILRLELNLFADFDIEVDITTESYPEAYIIVGDDVKRLDSGPIEINFNLANSISFRDFAKAMHDFENKTLLDSEHYLINALKLYNKGEYRQCLIDCATAVEIGLSEMFYVEISEANEKLLGLIEMKYKMIANLREGLKYLGIATPNELIELVAKPRNEAVHKGMTPARDDAYKALETTKSFVENFLI